MSARGLDKSVESPAGTLILATRNEHKISEFRELLPGWEISPLPVAIELPPETGVTFADNALDKARAAVAAIGRAAIADDSGIAARALGGEPGVRSARYAGERASDSENLDKLISALSDHRDRRVEYVCALALVVPGGVEYVVEGRCGGRLIDRRRGTGGFGYDPCVIPDDLEDDRTMAELTPHEKNAISHRGRAARSLLTWLAEQRDDMPWGISP